MRVLISGASGLVGTALKEYLRSQHHLVVSLVREEIENRDTEILWKPEADWLEPTSIEGFDAIVHLAGENIGDKRWNEDRKRLIVESRVRSTNLLARTISNLSKPPKVFLSASAVGFYGSRGDQVLSEQSEHGQGFLAETTMKWEEAAKAIESAATRLVIARFGAVLSPNGGALAKMLPFFKAGVGGVVGSGEQFVSWISIDDLVAAIHYLFLREDLSGVFNLTSPNPVTNKEFTHGLAKALHRPAVVPVPKFAITTLYGEMGEATVLASQRAVPERLIQAGFAFRYAEVESALVHLLA